MVIVQDCPDCEGSGEVREMVCYGGPPHETLLPCRNCEGTGEIRFDDGYETEDE